MPGSPFLHFSERSGQLKGGEPLTQTPLAGMQILLMRLRTGLATLVEGTRPQSSISVLDGVRAIACLLVISFHISQITRNQQIFIPSDPSHLLFSTVMFAGASGVTLFFILSGFLLFMPYAKSLLFGSDWPSARFFYLRRLFRIVPAYYVCLLLIVLFVQPQYLKRDHLGQLGLFLTFFMDSSQSTYHQLNGPFWTLAVEWQYYMILPLVALGMRLIVRRGSLKWRIFSLTVCLLALIGWGLLTRHLGIYFMQEHPEQSFLVPRSVLNTLMFFIYGRDSKYLEDFAVGMIICLCYVYLQKSSAENPLKSQVRHLSLWLWRAGILILVFMALWHFNNDTNSWPFLNMLSQNNLFEQFNEIGLSLGFGLCVVAILFGPAELQSPFTWPPLRLVGIISFSLYMWHLPLLNLFAINITVHLLEWKHVIVYSLYWVYVVAIIVPFSLLSYLMIEKPWMQLGERFRKS